MSYKLSPVASIFRIGAFAVNPQLSCCVSWREDFGWRRGVTIGMRFKTDANRYRWGPKQAKTSRLYSVFQPSVEGLSRCPIWSRYWICWAWRCW